MNTETTTTTDSADTTTATTPTEGATTTAATTDTTSTTAAATTTDDDPNKVAVTTTDGEQKDAKDGKAEGEGDQKKDAPTQNAAPETYADFALPDGVVIDAKAMEQFVPIAKELDLTQDQAQKLVSLRAQQVQAEAAAYEALVASWAEEAKADPEIGGDKFDATLKAAQAAYAEVATPALREMLDSTGYGNHPEVLRMFANVSKRLGLDSKPPTGTDPARGERSLAERMYPGMTQT